MSFHSQRFGRAAETYSTHAQVQNLMGDHLLKLLPDTLKLKSKTPFRILEMGCGTGLFTKKLVQQLPASQFWITDASEKMLAMTQKGFPKKGGGHFDELLSSAESKLDLPALHFSTFDASGKTASESEFTHSWVPPGAPFHLAASNALVQWFPNLNLHFERVASFLAPEGCYLVAGFTRGNFPELNALLREKPFHYTDFPGHEQEEVRLAAIQSGFAFQAWMEEPVEMPYASPEAFLNVLKGLGSSRRPGREPLTQAKLKHLVDQYRLRYRCEGGIKATWIPWYARLSKIG